jgi:hypothetical protein
MKTAMMLSRDAALPVEVIGAQPLQGRTVQPGLSRRF